VVVKATTGQSFDTSHAYEVIFRRAVQLKIFRQNLHTCPVAPETAAATQNCVDAHGFFAYPTGIRDFSLLSHLHDVSSGWVNRLLTATYTWAIGQLCN